MGPAFDAPGTNEGPHSWDEAIGALAERQHGVVSLTQLLALGLTRRAIMGRSRPGRLIPLHHGVYAVGHTALTARSGDMAAVLACGPGALLSHRSAAHSWELLSSSSARIEVTASRGCKPKPGITIHRSRLIHADDHANVSGIPTTGVARTLVDLADVVSECRLGDAVNEAEVRRLFDLRSVEATLAPAWTTRTPSPAARPCRSPPRPELHPEPGGATIPSPLRRPRLAPAEHMRLPRRP